MTAPMLSEGWTRTVDDGITNPGWDAYDTLIRGEVADYNRRLAGTPGFVAVDWSLFKALLWVESGGPRSAAWTTRPMQIGNPGDAGYGVLKNGQEAAPLVMSDALQRDLKAGDINQPELNVRAGIAYALTRLARSEIRSVDDPANPVAREYSVGAGDSLSRIAEKTGSTVESLKKLNPTALVLKPGQKLKVRRARMQRVITGWHPVTATTLAQRYNTGGDPAYALKLEYVLSRFPRLER